MIRHALERPVSTLIGACALVVLGTFSLLRLPVSLLPELERPALVVLAEAPGRAREEVAERVTRPLERRLAAIAGVTSVRSATGDGFARLTVESEWQTDADRLRIEAERLLGSLDDPAVALSIEMAAGDPEPIVEVAVLGGPSRAARSELAREVLVPELARLEGAGRLETLGLTPLHVTVTPRAAALAARGLTAADLVERLRPVGTARPAGRARVGAAVRPLLVREEVPTLEHLRALRIAGPRGESVLGDVARVGVEEIEDGSLFRLGTEDGVLVRVFRAPGANAVALAGQVRERVDELAARTGSGLRVQVVDDRSAEVVSALSELGLAALLGVGLGTLVLRALLGRWRPTLALAVVVPASVLTTFAAFHLGGISLDVVSLAGLALAAGMLVDSSIVVLEAIETARADGEPAPALAGTRQIALPVVAGFLTTAVVFLPLLYLQGLARAFFGVQAFAIAASLAASLLFSLTVTPVLAGNRGSGGEAGGRDAGRRAYLALLDRVLARPAGAVLAGGLVLAAGLAALALLPRELVPDGAARALVVSYRLPPSLSPEAARRLGTEVGRRTREALGGGAPAAVLALQWPEDRAAAMTDRDETGRLVLSFADAAAAARARRRVAAGLSRLPDVDAWVEPRTGAFVESIERAGRRLEVVATASTPERAAALAGRVADRMRRAAGLRVKSDPSDRPQPALLLAWDAGRLAALGALGADRDRLEDQVRSGLGEEMAGRVRIDGVEPEIVVRGMEPRDPALLPLALPAAGTSAPAVLPLGALAKLTPGARPAALERQDGRAAVRLEFGGAGADALQGADPEAVLAALPLAADEEVAPSGQALELRRAFSQLRVALGLSLILVFLTIAAVYESLTLPLAVMVTVPVALGGALGLLAVTGQSLDVLSFLGLVLLGGIVVNNAIVLVHRAEQHRAASLELDAAIRRAAAERYRPILMTTLTTLLGMLPLALLGGEGVELRRGLAVAVLGGLTTSTFASLLLVPVLYRALSRRRRAA